MQILYTLTEEEYNDLLVVKEQPDALLRDTNTQLKKKLDECQTQLQQGAFDNSRVDTPFVVTDGTLHFRSPTDFIIMWNVLAKATVPDSDRELLDYFTNLATIFNYDCQFVDTLSIKRYRVNLSKKNIITKTAKKNGVYHLVTGA